MRGYALDYFTNMKCRPTSSFIHYSYLRPKKEGHSLVSLSSINILWKTLSSSFIFPCFVFGRVYVKQEKVLAKIPNSPYEFELCYELWQFSNHWNSF